MHHLYSSIFVKPLVLYVQLWGAPGGWFDSALLWVCIPLGLCWLCHLSSLLPALCRTWCMHLYSSTLTNYSGFVISSGLQTFYSRKHFDLNLDEFWNVYSLLIYCSILLYPFALKKNACLFKDNKFLLKLTCIRSSASANLCGFS